MKSMNCISAMGRMPISAAPEAAPTMGISEIGVSITRSGPKGSISPALALRRAVDSEDVVSVDGLAFAADGHRLVGERLCRRLLRCRRGVRVAVVFDDDDHGQ